MGWSAGLVEGEDALGASCARLGLCARSGDVATRGFPQVDITGGGGLRGEFVTRQQLETLKAAYAAALKERLRAVVERGEEQVEGMRNATNKMEEEERARVARTGQLADELRTVEESARNDAQAYAELERAMQLKMQEYKELRASMQQEQHDSYTVRQDSLESLLEKAVQLERQAALLKSHHAIPVPEHGDAGLAAADELRSALKELERAKAEQAAEIAHLDKQLADHSARFENAIKACCTNLDRENDLPAVKQWLSSLTLSSHSKLDEGHKLRLQALGIL